MRYSSADLEKIEKYEYKRGINYIKFGDRSYNRIIAVTFLFWFYMMAMVSLYVLGFYMGIRDYADVENSPYKWTPYYITMLVTTAVTLLTPVLYATFGIIAHNSAAFKLKLLRPFRLALIAINAVTTPILFVQFAMISLNDGVPLSGTTSAITDPSEGFLGLKRLFYLRHGIPMLFVFVLCVVLIWLYLRQRYKMKKVFEKITKNEENYKIINDDE